MSKATARAIVRHEYDEGLSTTVRTRIGYIAEDGNKWKGPWRMNFAAARRDAREYNLAQRAQVN